MELTVEVSRELAASLAAGEELVIRLRIGQPDPPATPPVGPPRGPLAPLLISGALNPGDRLFWHRPRRRQRFTATVLASGELEVDGRRYQSPSDAATACAGASANGWTAWRRESDGAVLNTFR
ncbi:hypothetical protein Vqi01_41650 [Micromonospora qiuiae]|uniref:RAMA domain-containing protein n=2 Tax=Micromonospora qiuiae TaxID=502268 RepID=A0ABQ4JFD6_9ACTN|nr:hypothetical protein Vqi01_41650 [Micromonospora qiuiae]